MSDLYKAAQQALEALEDISNCHVGDYDLAGECASCHEASYKPHSADCKKQNSIDALRTALAQQAEPVRGWQGLTKDDFPAIRDGDTAFLSGALWADRLLKEKNT